MFTVVWNGKEITKKTTGILVSKNKRFAMVSLEILFHKAEKKWPKPKGVNLFASSLEYPRFLRLLFPLKNGWLEL